MKIEQALKRILKFKPQDGQRGFQKAAAAQFELAQATRKKANRQAGIAALRQIATQAAPQMRPLGVYWLSQFATPGTTDLHADLRAALADPLTCLEAARGLCLALGSGGFPDIVAAVGDKSLPAVARVQLLDVLALESMQPWDQLIPATLAKVEERHFQLKKLKGWVADGCPLGESVAPLPQAGLKKLGIKLPADYAKFLKQFRGGTPYRDRSGNEWQLTPAAHLLTEGRISETRGPNVGLLRAFAESDGDEYVGDDAQGRAKLKRLNCAIVIGRSGEGTPLFLDSTDKFSVCTVDLPFVERISRKAASFADWMKKVKPVQVDPGQNVDAIAALTAYGGTVDVENGFASAASPGLGASDDVLAALRKLTDLSILYWNRIDDPRINDAMHVVATLIFLDRLELVHTPLNDEGLLRLKTLWHAKKIEAWGTKITPKAVAALQKALPEVKIVSEDPYAVDDDDDEDASPTYRCPVSCCAGWVDWIDDGDEAFWGCGECGSMWEQKKNLMAEITQIIKKYKYRAACYLKAGRAWEPAAMDDEPDDYEELVEQEEEDPADEYRRG